MNPSTTPYAILKRVRRTKSWTQGRTKHMWVGVRPWSAGTRRVRHHKLLKGMMKMQATKGVLPDAPVYYRGVNFHPQYFPSVPAAGARLTLVNYSSFSRALIVAMGFGMSVIRLALADIAPGTYVVNFDGENGERETVFPPGELTVLRITEATAAEAQFDADWNDPGPDHLIHRIKLLHCAFRPWTSESELAPTIRMYNSLAAGAPTLDLVRQYGFHRT